MAWAVPRDDPDQKAFGGFNDLMVSDETSSSAKFVPIGCIDSGLETPGIGGGDGVGIDASGCQLQAAEENTNRNSL
jgi:hypothetical protein